jgi:hypothetical protein
MMFSVSRVLLLLLVALVAAACAARGDAVASGPEGARLRVENRSWSDVRVYAVTTAGQRIRIGNVTGSSTATLGIPASVVGGGSDLVFQVDPVGSRATASSFRIFVRPGDNVTITIPPVVR